MYYLLDTNFNLVHIIESFKSMIWTTRYYKVGDFELYISATVESVALYKKAAMNHYYIINSEKPSEAMIVSKMEVVDEYDNGKYIAVSGKSLKHILDRRVVWGTEYLSGPLEKEMIRVVNENCVSPEQPYRRIPGLYIKDKELEVKDIASIQLSGCSLSSAFEQICETYKVGWDVELDLENKRMYFVVYRGADRSHKQDKPPANPYVIFSPSMDNLVESDYVIDYDKHKNVCLVESYLENVDEKTNIVSRDPFFMEVLRNSDKEIPSGLDRYETVYVSSSIGKGAQSNAFRYSLVSEAHQLLINNKYEEKITGEVIPNLTYKFEKDYFIGDVVSIKNQFNMVMRIRVIEVIKTEDTSQITRLPSFIVEEDDEDSKPSEIKDEDCRVSIVNGEEVYRISEEEGSIRTIEKFVTNSRDTTVLDGSMNYRERSTENNTIRKSDGRNVGSVGRDISVRQELVEIQSKWR